MHSIEPSLPTSPAALAVPASCSEAEGAFCVWVDADSCPRQVRRVLLRTASRLNRPPAAQLPAIKVRFHFVAASAIPVRPSPQQGVLCSVLEDVSTVLAGQQACDRFILQHLLPGDMVLTRDIAFAQQICCQYAGVCVLNDRGTEYNQENVAARRLQRDLALDLRQQGRLPASLAGPGYSAKDLQQFAACLDRCLQRRLRGASRAALQGNAAQ